MSRYGWDAHHRDWDRGPMDLARARREGIDLFTHKSSEGSTYTDPKFDAAMTRAQHAGFPVVGAYHVLWPNNPGPQADFWISRVNTYAPWWRDHPCWVFQVDAELFQNFRPYRKPTVAEINACGDRIVAKTGCRPSQVVVYGPKWLYGDGLKGLRYRLWASAYVNGTGGFKTLYPGDGDSRWGAYSGIVPTILQYSSSATIAGQSPADANAIRVPTVADLQALFLGDDMPTVKEVWRTDGIVPAPDPGAENAFWQPASYLKGTYNQARAANVKSAANAAKLAAVLEAVKGAATQAQLDAALDAFKADLAATLAPDLADAVAAALGDVDTAVIHDACAGAVRDVLGSLDA